MYIYSLFGLKKKYVLDLVLERQEGRGVRRGVRDGPGGQAEAHPRAEIRWIMIQNIVYRLAWAQMS